MPQARRRRLAGRYQVEPAVWDAAAKRSQVQVVYNFGREEPGTREALERLVDSVARHLEPGKARAVAADGLEFAESRPLGGTWVLDALWERLGIGPALRSRLKGRRLDRDRPLRRLARPIRAPGQSSSPLTASSPAWRRPAAPP